MSTPSMATFSLPDAPFRGLESLRFVDKAIFAGRKEETSTLLAKLTLYRAVALYGETGTGKSSLINAGVLPKVLAENYVADRIRVQPFPNREIKIERIRLSDDEIAGYLPSNFTPENEDNKSELSLAGFELSLPAFKRQVRKMRLWRKPSAVRSFDLQRPRRALLIFDQFEEAVTLFQDAQRKSNPDEGNEARVYATRAQRAILINILRMIRDERLPIKILLAFREDYMAKLRLFFDHCPEVLGQAQRLVLPQANSLPDIIREPFKREDLRAHFVGKRAEARSEIDIELAYEIASQLTERGEPDTAILTELQIVCRRLWQSSDPKLLFKNKGIHGLTRDYLIEVFSQFPEELRDSAIVLLGKMLTNSNTRNIVSDDDLVDRTSVREHIPRETLTRALDLLADSRIVRREPRGSLHVYEITSEYLVPWIKDRVGERKALAFEKLARERRRRFVTQRRRTVLFQRLVAILAALVLVLIALGGFAGYEYKKLAEAKRSQFESEHKRLAAEAETRLAKEQQAKYDLTIEVITAKNDADKLGALNQIKQWSTKGDFPYPLALLLATAQSRTANPQVKQAVDEVLAMAAQHETTLSESIATAADTNPSLAEKLPARFYLHIPGEDQRPGATKVAAAIKQQGWLVPGIQVVGVGSAPRWDNELRYFRKDEPGMPSADSILNLLKATTGTNNWKDAYNSRYEKSTNIRPGHFEIWFAAPTGQVAVSFIDESGAPLRGLKFTLSFVLASDPMVRFKSHASRITVPPGDYEVRISVSGYRDLNLSLSLKANDEVDWKNLKLERD